MKGYGYAGLLIAAAITSASAGAASSEQQGLPAPAQQLEAAAQKESGQAAQALQKPQTHFDALLQRQMRQLERMREEAQRDEERAQKLRQLLEQS